MSPEICYGNDYTLKCDMWAIGCVLYELILLRQAFSAETVPALVLRIIEGRFDPIPEQTRSDYQLAASCAKTLLSVVPEDRPSTSALLSDPQVNKKVKLWQAVSGDIFAHEAKIEADLADSYLARTLEDPQKELNARPPTMSLSSPCSSLSKVSPSCWSSSVSHVDESSRREEMSKFIFEQRRVLRWGCGQRKPILDYKIFDKNIKEIAASVSSAEEAESSLHVLGLSEEGLVFSWGSGARGRLGHGHATMFDARDPTAIKTFEDYAITISQVSCGNSFSAAVSSRGDLWIWGDLEALGEVSDFQLLRPIYDEYIEQESNDAGPTKDVSNDLTNTTSCSLQTKHWPNWAKEAAANIPKNEADNPFRKVPGAVKSHSVAVNACWPAWAQTAAGLIAASHEVANPFKSPSIDIINPEPPQGKFDGLGDKRKLLRRQRKTRQLPTFATREETINEPIATPTLATSAEAASTNKERSLSVTPPLTTNPETTLVASDNTDVEIDKEECVVYAPRALGCLSSRRLVAVSCGSQFITVLTNDGELLAWGENDYGQLGQGDDERRDMPCSVCWGEEVIVVKSISAGAEYVLAVTSTDEAFSWGRGIEGQLGNGQQVFDDPQVFPTKVQLPPECAIAKVVAGVFHSAAVTINGELYTWGDGRFGQLGQGDKESRLAPCLVEELGRNGEDEHVVNVACGTFHSLALTHTGTVYSFGKGEGGSLGHSSERDIAVPKVVAALSHSSIVDIAALGFASVAISLARGSHA